MRTISRAVASALCAIGLTAATGCFLATDLVSRDVLLALNLDPRTVAQDAGSVIVTFTNRTTTVANFQIIQVDNPDNLAAGGQTIPLSANPNETVNRVLSCPTGGLTYANGLLREGVQYSCGDVVAFTLAAPTGQNPGAGTLTVQILPGR